MNSFSFAALTDVGTVRTNNEDSALASSGLLALADGMGGHAAGEVASAVVMHALTRLLAPGAEVTPEAVTEATRQARGVLRGMSLADAEMEGMGTTLVGLGVGPEGMVLIHVGDSRIYRVRDGEVAQLTTDHTHVQRLVDSGRLDPGEVRNHPYRSVILRSIDDTSDDLPDVTITDDVRPGDRILLCSDGLSDYVTHESLVEQLRLGSPLDAARALLRGALGAGTRDNVTVIVADVHDPEIPDGEGAPGREGDGAAPPHVPESPVLVGASLSQAELAPGARAVLLESFPDAAVLFDTLPRGGTGVVDEIDEDTLPPRRGAAVRAAAPEVGATVGATIENDDVEQTVGALPVAGAADDPAEHAGDDEPAPAAPTQAAPTDADLEERFGPQSASSTSVPTTAPATSPTAAATPSDPGPGGTDPGARPAPRPRATLQDLVWLGLVVVSFAVVTLSVWFTES